VHHYPAGALAARPGKTPMSEKLVVIYTPFASDWHSLIEEQGGSQISCKYFTDQKKRFWQRFLKRPNLNTAIEGLRAVLYARKHHARLLVTIGPRLSFWCGLFCRLLRIKVDHYAFAFNFADLPGGWKRKLFGFGFRQLKSLRVASQTEKSLYSSYFGIPEGRIEVRLWGMNIPDVSADPPVLNEPYVSAVGGNARDYQTLLGAARLLGTVPMVWVVRPENVAGLDLPPHVHVLRNIPYPHAMNVVANSRLTVVPLKDSKVPCGHVTLVSGMLLKKPVVATNSAGVVDYVTDGWNGLLCEPHSPADMAEKIRTLWEEPETARKLGENGFRFASEHCSERSVREDLSAILRDHGLS
jgi:glycosyltransferase involved in cell wall biosynthesis